MPRFPALLAEAGYSTAAVGKLHYLPYSPPGSPRLTHGFQAWRSAESGRILKEFDPEGKTRGLEDYFDSLSEAGWHGYSRAHGVGNNDVHPAVSPLPEELNVDAWVADEAVAFLRDHRANGIGRPFFLNVGYPKPHPPFDPPTGIAFMYDPREVDRPAVNRDGLERTPTAEAMRLAFGHQYLSAEAIQVIRAHYYALITFQDRQTARILDALEETGFADDTIVVFTADHGEMLGDFGFYFKSCMYEGSVHIPLMLAGPGVPARTDNSLAGLQDLLPTLCPLCGIETPADIDGIDLLACPGDQSERSLIVSYSLDSPHQTAMITDGRLKLIVNEIGGVRELYNLELDQREERNLIADPRYQTDAQRLERELVQWAINNGDEQLVSGSALRVAEPIDTEKLGFREELLGWRWY